MTPRDFCYWLQGFVEMRGGGETHITKQEWQAICDHLGLVMEKETPDRFNILDSDEVYDVPTQLTC